VTNTFELSRVRKRKEGRTRPSLYSEFTEGKFSCKSLLSEIKYIILQGEKKNLYNITRREKESAAGIIIGMSEQQLEPNKIWVGGLSWKTTDVTLREHFEAFGEVSEATVAFVKATGQPRGFGFVVFVDSSVVSEVVRQSHTIDGKHVDIKRAVPREAQVQESLLPPGVTAPVSATAATQSNSAAGTSSSSTASSSSGSGNSNVTAPSTSGAGGQGSSSSSSTNASSSSSKPLTMGPGVSGALPRPNPSRNDRRKIFVGGLAATVDNNVFREYFERYGVLEDVIVMMDRETRRSRGFGFIVFTEEPPAHQVMADAPHTIHNKVVEVKLAVPKADEAPAVSGGGGFNKGGPQNSGPMMGGGGGGGSFGRGGQPMHMQQQQQGYPGVGMGRGGMMMMGGGVGGVGAYPVQMGGPGIGGPGIGGPGIGGPVAYIPNYGQQQMMQPQQQQQYYAQPQPMPQPGPGQPQQQWVMQPQPQMVMPQQQQQQPMGMWPQQMQPAVVGQPMYAYPQQQQQPQQPQQQQGGYIQTQPVQPQMLQYPPQQQQQQQQQQVATAQMPQQQPQQQQPQQPQQQQPQQPQQQQQPPQVAPVDPRKAARDAAAAAAASSTSTQGGEAGSGRSSGGPMPRNDSSGKDRQYKPF
jgi:RNA recognition motif-containing protein